MFIRPSAFVFDVFSALIRNSEISAVYWIDLQINLLKKTTIFFDAPNWAVTTIELLDSQGHKATREQFIDAQNKRIMLWLQPTSRLLIIPIESGKTRSTFYSIGSHYVLIFKYHEDTAIRLWLRSSIMPKTSLELSDLLMKLDESKPHEYWEWPDI
jgi:hypothetical protein